MDLSHRPLWIFLSILLFSGCSPNKSSMDELRRLCEKDAGVKIYRRVNANGYYNGSIPGTSLLDLIRSDFEFIEFCDFNPSIKKPLEKPGCGRMTRRSKDSGRCHPWLQEILDESFSEPYASFRKNFCVEFEPIGKPEARYFYETHLDTWQASDEVGQLRKSRAWIRDMATSELLGEYIMYSLLPSASSMIYKHCDDIDESYPTFVEVDLINTVLSNVKN